MGNNTSKQLVVTAHEPELQLPPPVLLLGCRQRGWPDACGGQAGPVGADGVNPGAGTGTRPRRGAAEARRPGSDIDRGRRRRAGAGRTDLPDRRDPARAGARCRHGAHGAPGRRHFGRPAQARRAAPARAGAGHAAAAPALPRGRVRRPARRPGFAPLRCRAGRPTGAGQPQPAGLQPLAGPVSDCLVCPPALGCSGSAGLPCLIGRCTAAAAHRPCRIAPTAGPMAERPGFAGARHRRVRGQRPARHLRQRGPGCVSGSDHRRRRSDRPLRRGQRRPGPWSGRALLRGGHRQEDQPPPGAPAAAAAGPCAQPSLKLATASASFRACSRIDCAAAADSSTSAAFCWVIWSSWVTAWLTCWMPSRCSVAVAAISPIRSDTRLTLPTISCMARPVWSTSVEPCSTLPTDAPISDLISLAASALRWASRRTSPATTAKPRPCSPARAASTAAFSARMLVWNAMPSITPMMSAILRELSVMRCMLSVTWPTTSPPRWAAATADTASWLACLAVSAL
mmetsp:Transcript_4994/g.18170  ORF Transcript_4994/g.18170 Transcript_4994/m.18170 type:complete len:512 (+) Transcript_4994:558-2093(+)